MLQPTELRGGLDEPHAGRRHKGGGMLAQLPDLME
jgi:hypothetical protein